VRLGNGRDGVFLSIGFPKRKPKKKAFSQGRREGMSGFLLKILPEGRGWRFLIKPFRA